MKVLLLLLVHTLCTVSMTHGCVSGAGPSWELTQSRGRTDLRGKGYLSVRPGNQGPIGRPSIPDAVMSYFGGIISKEAAFASIDLDSNGLVSLVEWIVAGGAQTEFYLMLDRLDTDGDDHISLDELQPFTLPAISGNLVDPRLHIPEDNEPGPVLGGPDREPSEPEPVEPGSGRPVLIEPVPRVPEPAVRPVPDEPRRIEPVPREPEPIRSLPDRPLPVESKPRKPARIQRVHPRRPIPRRPAPGRTDKRLRIAPLKGMQ